MTLREARREIYHWKNGYVKYWDNNRLLSKEDMTLVSILELRTFQQKKKKKKRALAQGGKLRELGCILEKMWVKVGRYRRRGCGGGSKLRRMIVLVHARIVGNNLYHHSLTRSKQTQNASRRRDVRKVHMCIDMEVILWYYSMYCMYCT